MNLFLSFLSLSVFLVCIVYGQECNNLDSDPPCECFIGKYQCLWHKQCSWETRRCSETVTDFPSYEPTPDPTQHPTEFMHTECGDHIHDTWLHNNITWILNIDSDTKSVNINACNSNYDTVLAIYPSETLETAIITSNTGCDNGISSLINIDHGLSAGTYYLLLSAMDVNSDGTYDIGITCEYKETDDIDINREECKEDCDAFLVRMMYYDRLSAYDTDNIYIDDDDAISSAAICYTYVIERIFNDGVCREGVDGIVLGVCDADGDYDVDLDRFIVSQIGGDLYSSYNSSEFGGIMGIKMDVNVDEDAIEFTLCMNGVNNDGILSDSVQFTRGVKKTYICRNKGNDGLPCFVHKSSESVAVIDSIFSRILWVLLFIVLSIMVIVSSFYHIVTNKNRFEITKPWRMSDINWSEIKVSDTTMTETDEPKTEKDPLDPSTDTDDNEKISDLSVNETQNGLKDEKIGNLKETLDDLNQKFMNDRNSSAERAVQHIRSYRNSVCSTVSENDETTILPIYEEYRINADSDGYWINPDISSNNSNNDP